MRPTKRIALADRTVRFVKARGERQHQRCPDYGRQCAKSRKGYSLGEEEDRQQQQQQTQHPQHVLRAFRNRRPRFLLGDHHCEQNTAKQFPGACRKQIEG